MKINPLLLTYTGWSILTVISNHTLKTEKISLSLKVKLFFHSQHREFLIFSFQIIPESISNYSSLKTFEVHKCESMENTLKINVFRKTILFCKYLHNRSSDLYEIWNLSSLDSNAPILRFSWRFLNRDAHERCKHAHAFLSHMRTFSPLVRVSVHGSLWKGAVAFGHSGNEIVVCHLIPWGHYTAGAQNFGALVCMWSKPPSSFITRGAVLLEIFVFFS